MRVMGIDPGLTRLGYGVVEARGSKLIAIDGGCLSTQPSAETHVRLEVLFDGLSDLLEEHRPDSVAVERVFFNLNAKTAVPVLRASGVALLAAAKSGCPVFEYSPLEVKEAVTGTGAATKEQVKYMVSRLLALSEAPAHLDHSDALALAICHLHTRRLRVVVGGHA